MLPTFLVIGAAKSGTTSLHRYLGEHPQVVMADVKEPEFFLTRGNWHRGLDWYESLFDRSDGVVAAGEASVGYSGIPVEPGLPRRIADTIPDVRLIYVVRNPTERIRSHYVQDFAGGREDRSLETVLRNDPFYVDVCRYGRVLESYERVFDRDRILVLRSEDLRARRRPTLSRIFAFIGVDPTWTSPLQEVEFNAPRQRVPRDFIRRARSNPIYRAASSVVPVRVKRSIDRRTPLLRRPVIATIDPSLSTETVAWLHRELAPDLVGLRAYLGPDFDCWGFTT